MKILPRLFLLSSGGEITGEVTAKITGGELRRSANPRRDSLSLRVIFPDQAIEASLSSGRLIRAVLLVDERPIQLGDFVIFSSAFSSSVDGKVGNLSLLDKMCYLDGTFGGRIDAPMDLGTKRLDSGELKPVLLRQIVFEVVNHIGGIEANQIFVDVPLEGKRGVRWTGPPMGFRKRSLSNVPSKDNTSTTYDYNTYEGGEIGYLSTPLVAPEDFRVAPGETVVDILERVRGYLGGGYEYFFDEYGNFYFQPSSKTPDLLLSGGAPYGYPSYRSQFGRKEEAIVIPPQKTIAFSINPNLEKVKNHFVVIGHREDGTILKYRLFAQDIFLSPGSLQIYKRGDKYLRQGYSSESINLYPKGPFHTYLLSVAVKKLIDQEPLSPLEYEAWYEGLQPPLIQNYAADFQSMKNAITNAPYLPHLGTSAWGSIVAPEGLGRDTLGDRKIVVDDPKLKLLTPPLILPVTFLEAARPDLEQVMAEMNSRNERFFLIPPMLMQYLKPAPLGLSCYERVRELFYEHCVQKSTIEIEALYHDIRPGDPFIFSGDPDFGTSFIASDVTINLENGITKISAFRNIFIP